MAVKDLDFSHYYTYQESKFSFDQPALQQKARQFEEYDRLADCPISSGIELNEYSDDKLHIIIIQLVLKLNRSTSLKICPLKKSKPIYETFPLINLSLNPLMLGGWEEESVLSN